MRHLVPQYILDRYLSGQARGSLQAAGVFVDLSGFSSMTDELARHGQHGAETLADLMRTVFQPMVDAVYAQGGFVVGYAGDAFTALFPEQQARGPALMRALSAVCALQRHIHAHPAASTPYGQFPIFIKAGLGLGEATWQIFRSVDGKRAAYCFRGESVSRSVAAEEHASPGGIVIDAAAYATLQDQVKGRALSADFFQLECEPNGLPVPFEVIEPEPDPDLDVLRAFCPDAILDQPITGEFRQVVNLFVDLPAGITDEMLVAPFMETVFELQNLYDGYLLRPDVGDKGFNLLMFWGAPSAHETDIDRALNFVMELSARTGVPLRAGVTYRTAFSGFIGASWREDYTAYGWGVNLSARLMESANLDEIRLDEETASRAAKHFEIEYLDQMAFKGFAAQQKVYLLRGRKAAEETIYHGDLVGRASEMARFVEFAAPLKEGRFAGVLVMQGEAGIGKSRLLHALRATGLPGLPEVDWAVCPCNEILRQSLNPFKDWLKKRFLISATHSETINRQNFEGHFQNIVNTTPDAELAAELTRTSSALAALLNLSQPGSLYDQLDAKGRYENTLIALNAFLRAESLQRPLILCIEDAHWMDEDTRAFLPTFTRTLLADPDRHYPIAILAVQRPDEPFIALDESVRVQVLTLERLSPTDLVGLATEVLGGPLTDLLSSLLEKRSEGNPFFAEQLLRYLSESHLLEQVDGQYTLRGDASINLPTDVSAVLIARLDRLAREVRETVQTASVLGREFEVRLLLQILRHPSTTLADHLKRAEQADIWSALNEMQYIFRHALLRDAAYSMQLLIHQRQLHTLAVEALETIYAQDLPPHYGELAYHAERSRLDEKALHYLTLAGAAASSAYQNAEALDYYRRALALVPANNLRVRFELLAERIALFSRIGNRAAELGDLNALEEVSRKLGDDHLSARYWKLRAYYCIFTADFPNTIDAAARAVSLAQAQGDMDIVSAAYNAWSGALLRQGKMEEAMQCSKDALAFAQQLDSLLEQGNALTAMGLIALEMKMPEAAQQYLVDAVAIARRIQNRSLEAKALNNLANLAGFIQGDFVSARDYYEQHYLIGREQGDRYMQGIALTNLGWVAGMLGDFSAARSYHIQSLLIARESENRYTEEYTLINLGAVVGVQGDAQFALQYTTQALELSRKIGDRGGEAWALFYKGQALLLLRDFDRAEDSFRQSIAIRTELGVSNIIIEATAGLVQVALEKGDDSAASSHAEMILSHLANGGTLDGAEEPLRIYLACYLALEKMQDPRAREIMRTAADLLETQVSHIHEEETRRRYVENVPWRRAVWKTWQSLQSDLD